MRNQFPKIHAPWKRDHDTGAFLEEWSRPEFEFLKDLPWHWSEKIDGTNIRVRFTRGDDNQPALKIQGRTDRAQMSVDLMERLQDLFVLDQIDALMNPGPVDVTFYGEGIGPHIQKGGGDLSPGGYNFVLFDVRIGHVWMAQDDVTGFAESLCLLRAPIRGTGTLPEATLLVADGFESHLHGAKEDHPAEGLVLRPMVELLDRRGARILTKLKTSDFRK